MGVGWSDTWSIASEAFPPKSQFSVNDIPDLSDKVVIVTGGNCGIGYETIKALLPRNARVYMASRSKERANSALEKLKAETGKDAIFLELDLADMAAIRGAAAEFKSKETKLHILFNNAGVMHPPVSQLTRDGYDLQFGTNMLGHYLFTKELLPLLEAGAKSSSDGKARVITTSSIAAHFYTINWNTLKDSPERARLGTTMLYCQSKFANIVVANELAKRYAEKGIVSISVNPGGIHTELRRHATSSITSLLNRITLYPTPQGALTQLWAGTSPETVTMNGKYLIPWARVGEPRKEATDPRIGERLWNWLEEQTK